jgi:thiosulfate/3-mercaptopyruvate sulfurtransferase
MGFTTLIAADALLGHLRDPDLAVIDCRFRLDDTGWGERAYEASHLPHAVYAHLDRDLSGPRNGRNGRHPLPEVSTLARTFGQLGIDNSVQVVAYDQDDGSFASRLWWLLRWLGHDAVAVLDGGFAAWQRESLPLAPGRQMRAPRIFSAKPRSNWLVDANEVERIAHNPLWRLVDARAAERFRGDVEPIDRVPGHIPGAVNHFFKSNVDERGMFLPPDRLRSHLQSTIGSVEGDHVVCYCGSGVTACQNLLALEHAGLPGAKLYAGSWSEWSSDPSRPVER